MHACLLYSQLRNSSAPSYLCSRSVSVDFFSASSIDRLQQIMLAYKLMSLHSAIAPLTSDNSHFALIGNTRSCATTQPEANVSSPAMSFFPSTHPLGPPTAARLPEEPGVELNELTFENRVPEQPQVDQINFSDTGSEGGMNPGELTALSWHRTFGVHVKHNCPDWASDCRCSTGNSSYVFYMVPGNLEDPNQDHCRCCGVGSDCCDAGLPTPDLLPTRFRVFSGRPTKMHRAEGSNRRLRHPRLPAYREEARLAVQLAKRSIVGGETTLRRRVRIASRQTRMLNQCPQSLPIS